MTPYRVLALAASTGWSNSSTRSPSPPSSPPTMARSQLPPSPPSSTHLALHLRRRPDRPRYIHPQLRGLLRRNLPPRRRRSPPRQPAPLVRRTLLPRRFRLHPRSRPQTLSTPGQSVQGDGRRDGRHLLPHYGRFKAFCYTAFTNLRKNANLILNLVALMWTRISGYQAWSG